VGWFFHAVQVFLDHLTLVALAPLGLAVLCHVLKMACRARAWGNIVAAAYPASTVRYRDIFGAYAAGVGVNTLVPARGGDLVKLYLARRKVEGATYTTLASTFLAEAVFDVLVVVSLVVWAISQGLLPGLDVIPRLPGSGLNWMLDHPIAASAVGVVLATVGAYGGYRASRHVVAFRRRVVQGLAILGDGRRYARSVLTWQAADWCFRILGVVFLLQAFGIAVGGDPATRLESGLLVQASQSVSSLVPFTPSGIGADQALAVYVLAGDASMASLLAFSVGSALLMAAVNLLVGFGAIFLMLRSFRWKRHMLAAEPPIVTTVVEQEAARAPASPL
jgi:glycosyltransferase 2 family protein